MSLHMFVKVKDNKGEGNYNIWLIKQEIQIDNINVYEIHSRTTVAFIEKELCFIDKDSCILCYENNDRRIDIWDSEIDIESEEEYEEFLEKELENINPFRVYEEVDIGKYDEDESGMVVWDLCDLMCPDYDNFEDEKEFWEEGEDEDV